MKVVRGQREARFLPSRHNYAIFRLFAFLRLRGAKSDPCDCVMVVDRHQSAFETQAVAIWGTLTIAAWIASELSKVLPWFVAAAIAPLAAAFLLEIPIIFVGSFAVPLWNAITGSRIVNNLRLNSIVYMLLMSIAAVHYAVARSWVRFVAWQFLAALLLNAIAAAVVYFLRGPIGRLESKFGGPAFEH